MNFRVVIAKATHWLGLMWVPISFGYFLLVAFWDWPLPQFLDRLDEEDFHTLVTLIFVVPSIALLLASEKLAPPGFWDSVRLAGWLHRMRRAQ